MPRHVSRVIGVKNDGTHRDDRGCEDRSIAHVLLGLRFLCSADLAWQSVDSVSASPGRCHSVAECRVYALPSDVASTRRAIGLPVHLSVSFNFGAPARRLSVGLHLVAISGTSTWTVSRGLAHRALLCEHLGETRVAREPAICARRPRATRARRGTRPAACTRLFDGAKCGRKTQNGALCCWSAWRARYAISGGTQSVVCTCSRRMHVIRAQGVC